MSNQIVLTYEPLTQRHLNACTMLATQAPDPWSAKNVAAELKSPRKADYVAISKQGVIGFAFFSIEDDYAMLNQLVVDSSFRHCGVGTGLLKHAIEKFTAQNISRILLEVRASNQNAINLYQKLGFTEIAQRPALYSNPNEDGLTFEKILL